MPTPSPSRGVTGEAAALGVAAHGAPKPGALTLGGVSAGVAAQLTLASLKAVALCVGVRREAERRARFAARWSTLSPP
jgi:hypothetical protein